MIDCCAVLIIDTVDDRELSLQGANFEFADDDEYDELVTALRRACRKVVTYETPKEFINNIQRHTDDVVISVWSGEHSRNRKALVPSICEAYGIRYVGADTYTNVLAQDKALSKSIARQFGFHTPPSVLIDAEADLSLLRALRYPAVVKPNFEGGSIGISQRCLVHDERAAHELIATLLAAHHDSVLVEQFIRGREVSYVVVGNREEILFAEAVELVLLSDNLPDMLWSYEIKQSPDVKEEWRLVTGDLDASTRDNAIRLFRALGKVELLRVDGRIDDAGRFQFIELSPDAYLGSDGAVGAAYALRGQPLHLMLEDLIRNARRSR
jgi:D-alanine-D-alanine ligase